jgi:hypothetical protein
MEAEVTLSHERRTSASVLAEPNRADTLELELEVCPAAENETGKGRKNNDDALHEKTSVFRCGLKYRFGSSPIPLVMEERSPLR